LPACPIRCVRGRPRVDVDGGMGAGRAPRRRLSLPARLMRIFSRLF
jgi:hypothetical protein